MSLHVVGAMGARARVAGLAGPNGVEVPLASERAGLVRLCARLTGDLDAAEDLAQETLFLAWREARRLRDPDRRWPWLMGIARNLSLHWVRRRGRERRHLAPVPPGVHPASPGARDTTTVEAAAGTLDQVPNDVDLEVELERTELATLLDRAMALLPADTRRVLVERYVEESPQARTALRLGLTEGAVAMRLQRGKLALRRILATDLREEAAAYGLVEPEREAWQTTRIWCPACGERTLVGRFTEQGRLALHCIGCRAVARLGRSRNRYTESGWPALFQGVKGFKPALNRVMRNVHQGFAHGIGGRTMACFRCGIAAPMQVTWEAMSQKFDAWAQCPRCAQGLGHLSTAFLLLARPEGRRFWREHRRVRGLPEQVVEAGGRPAIVARLQSVASNAELAVVYDRDTLQVLGIHGALQAASLLAIPFASAAGTSLPAPGGRVKARGSLPSSGAKELPKGRGSAPRRPSGQVH